MYKFKKVGVTPWSFFTIYLFMEKIEVLSELHRSQESGYNLRDESREGHLDRAKICSKLIKYPNIEDYAVC